MVGLQRLLAAESRRPSVVTMKSHFHREMLWLQKILEQDKCFSGPGKTLKTPVCVIKCRNTRLKKFVAECIEGGIMGGVERMEEKRKKKKRRIRGCIERHEREVRERKVERKQKEIIWQNRQRKAENKAYSLIRNATLGA